MKTLKLIVHQNFDAFYDSFYVQGFHEVFPRGHIRYSRNDFPAAFVHRLAFIVEGSTPRKVYVCHSDFASYNDIALRWSDVYAKINIDPHLPSPGPVPHILPIGPSFATRIYSPIAALYRAFASFRLADANPREHFANYYRQRRYRLPEAAYTPAESNPNYLFFTGSLWHDEAATNLARATFMEAGAAVDGIKFEGGFAPRPQAGDDPPGYDHLKVSGQYPFPEYLEKTKRSVVVFNTPAVGGCLGWKLGEFLALGKAIISTPLFRVLPAPLIHGTHIHYVEPTREAMRGAIEMIRRDESYRRTLERGARQYYQDNLRPSAVVTSMVKAADAV